MTRAVVRPDRLDLDSPGRRDYWLALEHDSIWGDHLVPPTGRHPDAVAPRVEPRGKHLHLPRGRVRSADRLVLQDL